MKKSLLLLCAALTFSCAGPVLVWSGAAWTSKTEVPAFTVSSPAVSAAGLLLLIAVLCAVLVFAGLSGKLTDRRARKGNRITALLTRVSPVLAFFRDPRPPVTLLVLLMTGQAFATAPALGEGGIGGSLLGLALPALQGALLAGILAGLVAGAKYVKARVALVRNERLRAVLALVTDLAFEKVRQLAQEAVGHLKAASADGRLTPEEARAAALTAVKEVWASLPADVRKLLVTIAGSEVAAQDAFIRPKVENSVAAQTTFEKAQAKAINLQIGQPRVTVQSIPAVPTAVQAAARARIGLELPRVQVGSLQVDTNGTVSSKN